MRHGESGLKPKPRLRMHLRRKAICATPPRRIAQHTAATRASTESPGMKQRAASADIQKTFKTVGMSAPSTNLPSAFRTPIPNAAPHMKTMYGHSMRTSLSVSPARGERRLRRDGISRKAESPITDKRTIEPRTRRMVVRTARASFLADSSAPLSTSPLKTGTNAAVRAPSPNTFLAMLGIANASTKALCSMPAPRILDCIISRTRPRTREKAVRPPTVKTFARTPLRTPTPYFRPLKQMRLIMEVKFSLPERILIAMRRWRHFTGTVSKRGKRTASFSVVTRASAPMSAVRLSA